jgi:hypothetical protein
MSTLGKDTFGLTKTEFNQKLGRIITNHRANSRLIGEARDFVLRCCRLTDQWGKLANDSETLVYLRNLEIAGGRKVKMLSLERGGSQQPIPKAKLVSALYPTKKIATTATPEQKHFNNVRVAMRFAVTYQLRAFRDSCQLPLICSISGKKIIPGQKTDVDHVGMTFSEIADCFLSEKGLKYTDITLKGPPTAKVFTDSQLWQEWVAWHMAKARYSLTLASANRSKGAGDYCTPPELLGSFKSDDPDCMSLDF